MPTKDKAVWRNLVIVDKIKVALNKLKEINWLYIAMDDSSIDETSKEIEGVEERTYCPACLQGVVHWHFVRVSTEFDYSLIRFSMLYELPAQAIQVSKLLCYFNNFQPIQRTS